MFLWDIIFWAMHSVGFFYKLYPTTFWNEGFGSWYGKMGYFFMGLCWLICLWGLFLDVLSFTVDFLNKKKYRSKSSEDEGEGELENASRRLLPQKALAFGGLGVVAGAAALGAHHGLNPQIYNVDIPLSKKYPSLKGMTITQLSDIHIGPVLKKDFLDDVVMKANKLKSDVIVITGDLIDGKVPQMESQLQALKELRAPMGVFYITGNHEYYWGGESWVEFVKSCEIETLINEHRILNFKGTDFVLAGVTDMKAARFVEDHRFDPEKSLAGAPKDLCRIMLAHRPKSCYEVQKFGADLQLSGHTHGGQGIPWKFVVGLVQPFLAGLYDYKGMWVYVNRGTGFWGPPARAGIKSEITKLTII